MLELLLGFTILVIAVFALFAVFPSGDKAVVRSVRMTQAAEIARGLMEEQLTINYSSLVLGETDTQRSSKELTRNGAEVETTYYCKVIVEEPDPTKKYRDIKVEVYWKEGLQQTRHGCNLESSRCELI